MLPRYIVILGIPAGPVDPRGGAHAADIGISASAASCLVPRAAWRSHGSAFRSIVQDSLGKHLDENVILRQKMSRSSPLVPPPHSAVLGTVYRAPQIATVNAVPAWPLRGGCCGILQDVPPPCARRRRCEGCARPSSLLRLQSPLRQ